MILNDYWIAAILGIVQGITEFLPISSSGHLILTSWILGGEASPMVLNVALHFGTLLAILLYFYKDWFAILFGLRDRVFYGKSNFYSDQLFPGIFFASIPVAVVGLLGKDWIEENLYNPYMVAIFLAVVGILIYLADRFCKAQRSLAMLQVKDAIFIGILQVFALFPGVSRSGSTILAARLLKFKKEDAAKFSFLLGCPPTFGAFLLHLKGISQHWHEPLFLIGVLVSCVVGCLAIRFLFFFIRKFSFLAFALYRLVLAGVILANL